MTENESDLSKRIKELERALKQKELELKDKEKELKHEQAHLDYTFVIRCYLSFMIRSLC